ncbi:two-component sensor histidine kinase, partial [Streptomyces sp. NPDC054835]
MPLRNPWSPGSVEGAGPGLTERSRVAPWVWTAVLLVAQILTLRPLGLSGRGLAVTVLFVVNFGVFALRLVPRRLLPDRLLLPLMVVGVAAAAGLLAVADTGT